MSAVTRVLVLEDDPYARDVMSTLLIRDWRTVVVGEVDTHAAAAAYLRENPGTVDILLVDAEHPNESDWAARARALALSADPSPRILFNGTHPDPATLRVGLEAPGCGYVLNPELGYSLAWAVAAAAQRWVTTPGVRALAYSAGLSLPQAHAVFDGRHAFDNMRPRERDVARLAILFNLRRSDIADELGISEHQVNKHVSDLYNLLGLTDILKGKDDPAFYFTDPHVLARFRAAQAAAAISNRRGAREKATLAFHMLTLPTEV